MAPTSDAMIETPQKIEVAARDVPVMGAANRRGTLSEASRGKRVLMFTSGSRGDVQPFAALGAALQSAGFVLRVLTNVNHVSFMKGFGLDAVAANMDAEKWLKEDPMMLECMAKGHMLKFMGDLAALNKREFPELLQKQLREFRDFRPDLILAAALEATQARAMGGVAGVPVVVCGLTPFCPTADEPSMLGEPAWLPGWVHLMAWNLMTALWVGGERDGKHAALLEQLPDCGPYLVENMHQHNHTYTRSAEPNLFGVSLAVCPAAKACPEGHRATFTGFWVVGQEEQKARMQGGDANFGGESFGTLCRFLKSGDVPAYVGWGSMVAVSAEHMACLAVRSLRLAGMRGVVLGGWAGLSAEKLKGQPDSDELLSYAEENVLFVSTAPHEWLFPQCFATVHHGGSGTTAAALRSGRPTIVTPCGFDQFFNARMVAGSGAGLALPQVARVTPAELAGALRRARRDQALIARAAALGEQLRAEDGLSTAVSKIDQFIREEVATGVWEARHKAQSAELKRLARPSVMQRLGMVCSNLCGAAS